MFKDQLFKIKEKVDTYAKTDPKELSDCVMQHCLDKKLVASYENYERELESKLNYILSRNNYKVIKAINKMEAQKNDEVDK